MVVGFPSSESICDTRYPVKVCTGRTGRTGRTGGESWFP
jgi:hypothetical protein